MRKGYFEFSSDFLKKHVFCSQQNEFRKVVAMYEAHFYLIYKQCSCGFTDLVMTEFL